MPGERILQLPSLVPASARQFGNQNGSQEPSNSVAWRALRANKLTVEPLFRMCKAAGRTTAANTVDHITPWRGDLDLFWSGPFQSLCAPCHSRFKQSQESDVVKHLMGCDEQGEPLFRW
jgi:hypothetical protein